jgi:CRISPR-associated protein Csm4
MKTYKINLEIYSSIMTPFQADTIFGHLCWAIAHQEGNKELERFLEPFRSGDPPFIVSDGFPGDLLPKPLTAEFIIDKPEERKEWKKINYLNLNDFNCIRRGEKCKPQIVEDLVKISSMPHNIINRLTNTTLSEAGVYSLKEISISNIGIYLKVVSEEWKDRVEDLLREVSKAGFGRKKSIGKGQFSVLKTTEFNFQNVDQANGFVTLSNFCPGENDPIEGVYTTFVKYGKLGEEFTFSGNPFKKPLVMFKSGSVFKTDGNPKAFYGRAITDGIAPAKPEVIQYAYAFAVPIKYPQIKRNL